MRKHLFDKKLILFCLIPFLIVMLFLSIQPSLDGARFVLRNWRKGNGLEIELFEEKYNDNLPGKHFFITLNGGFQRLMGVRHVNDRYRMNNGHLTYTISQTDTTEMAKRVIALRDALSAEDIPFVYINTPFKIDPQDQQLPIGTEDWSGANTDLFLKTLNECGINTLDLRLREKEQGLDHYAMFYPTDHHWTAEAGFWGYTEIVDYLTEMDERYRADDTITDWEQYDKCVYKDIFLGSAGRMVGSLYAGKDDLTVITPKFDTFLRFDAPMEGVSREGSYRETILFEDLLTAGSDYSVSRYSVYCGSDYDRLFISNASSEQNLTVQSRPRKILMLKDSFSSVVIPYLALSYDETCFVDLRIFKEDLLAFIRDYQPDLVLMMYNPSALETHNLNMFPIVQ